MKNAIETLQNRSSVRSFTGESVKKEDLELILKTMLRSPNTKNLQSLSFIVVNDKEKLEKVAEFCGGQKQISTADAFLLIVGDYAKVVGALDKENVEHEHILGNLNTIKELYIDAGVYASTFSTLSESLGYGSTVIGGVSHRPLEMTEYLGLPKLTFPLLGVTIGCPDPSRKNPTVKPRTNYENVVFFNEYRLDKAIDGVVEYNERLGKWWEELGLNMPSHLDTLKADLKEFKDDKLKEWFEKQGFINK